MSETYLFFLAVIFCRAQATYWIARLVATGIVRRTHPVAGWRARVHGWLQGDSAQGGVRAVNTYGPVAVTVSFLTVGAQTAVNAAAGGLRMPFGRYLVAMLPGCAAWALIWTTIGFGAFYAAVGAGAGSAWGIGAGVAAVGVVVIAVVVHRRRAAARSAR